MRSSSDFANLVVLCLITTLFFSPLLTAGTVFHGGELAQYAFYERVRSVLDFRAGVWPAWNPDFGTGLPEDLHGRYLSAFYPPNLLFFFLHPADAFNLTRCIHQVLTGFFMYLMLRGLFVGPSGAFVGGLVFALGGYPLARLWDGDVTTLNALTYFPLLFLCGLRALRGSWRYVGIGLVLLFMQAWDGSVGATLCQLFVLAAEALWVAAEMKSWRPLAVFAAWLLAALLLLAPFWLPWWAQTQQTGLFGLNAREVPEFNPLLWLTIPFPHLWGMLTEFTFFLAEPAAAVGVGLGMTATFLALMGARRTHRGLFFLALALLLGVVATGHYWGGSLVSRCPWWHQLLTTNVMWAGIHFCLAVLAGMGWERLFWDDGPQRSFFVLRILGWTTLGLAALLAALTYWPLSRFGSFAMTNAWFGWALGAGVFVLLAGAVLRGVNRDRTWGELLILLLLLGELVYCNARYLQMLPANSYLPQEEWKEWSAWGPFNRWQGRLLLAYPGSAQMIRAVPALDGCQWVSGPLRGGSDSAAVADPWCAYYSVRGIVTPGAGIAVRGPLLARCATGLHFTDGIAVQRPAAYLPFAFFSGKVSVRPQPRSREEMPAQPDWEQGEVVLHDAVDSALLAPPADGEQRLDLRDRGDDFLHWETELPSPAVLFVSQRWHPDWQATIDDTPALVLRANGELSALSVPAGRHTVKMRFLAPARRVALVLLVLALLATVFLLAGRREWRHPLSHTLDRTVQRAAVIAALALLLLGTDWWRAGSDLHRRLTQSRTPAVDYAAVARSFQQRGLDLPAYAAARLAQVAE